MDSILCQSIVVGVVLMGCSTLSTENDQTAREKALAECRLLANMEPSTRAEEGIKPTTIDECMRTKGFEELKE